jgi:deazaflavin-dependent oxidoreductase (nitroreductase family)
MSAERSRALPAGVSAPGGWPTKTPIGYEEAAHVYLRRAPRYARCPAAQQPRSGLDKRFRCQAGPQGRQESARFRLQPPAPDHDRTQERPGSDHAPRLVSDGNGGRLIAASANGAASIPAWYHNLAAAPDKARIEIKGATIPVSAEQLHGAEREAAWQALATAIPRFSKYPQKTDREIPVIRLTPRPS